MIKTYIDMLFDYVTITGVENSMLSHRRYNKGGALVF